MQIRMLTLRLPVLPGGAFWIVLLVLLFFEGEEEGFVSAKFRQPHHTIISPTCSSVAHVSQVIVHALVERNEAMERPFLRRHNAQWHLLK